MESAEWVSTCSVLWQDHDTMVISKHKRFHIEHYIHLVVPGLSKRVGNNIQFGPIKKNQSLK